MSAVGKPVAVPVQERGTVFEARIAAQIGRGRGQ